MRASSHLCIGLQEEEICCPTVEDSHVRELIVNNSNPLPPKQYE